MPLADNTIANVADRLAKRMSDVETRTLTMIASRIRAIGEIMPSDASRLARMRDVGGDVNRITAFLQQATNLNAAELDSLFAAAATDNLLFARKFYDVRNIPFIPYAENRPLQRVVEAQTRITAGELSNISQTTVMAGGGIDRREQFHPISQAYHEIVDRAITAVSSGVTDYNAAIRDALSAMARSGIRTIEYQSGLKRRADSAVRMNILDGVRAVNQSVDQQIGAEIGADGIELSAHMTCAPDHLPMQGRQFANAEFARLQTGQACRDYQGHTYAGLKRPIGMWNCRHFARSIILGVSKPVYTDQQLQQLREDNEKKITIGGREYTAYEASQLMRKIETQIRAAKNEAVVFEITGDKAAAAGAHTKVLQLTATYEAVAKAANQRMKYARIRVPGVGVAQNAKRVIVPGSGPVNTTGIRAKEAQLRAHEPLTGSGKSGIIKLRGDGVSTIRQPIEQRNTGKGNPNAMLHFDRPLNNRQARLLEQLPEFDSRVTIRRKDVNMRDLAALTANTGDEFAMFTRNGERLIVRGNGYMTNITVEQAAEMAAAGYRWSGHTHPGIDYLSTQPSDGDYLILFEFKNQRNSLIYNARGEFRTFERR